MFITLSVHAGAVQKKQNIMLVSGEEGLHDIPSSYVSQSWDVNMLACWYFSYRVLHHISRNFNCVTSVVCVSCVVTCASWKMKYDGYTQLPKCLQTPLCYLGIWQTLLKKLCCTTGVRLN
jgi:hypothetical protein